MAKVLVDTVIELSKPVFVVTSANWYAEIIVDDVTASMEPSYQVTQAASVALEVFKGIRESPQLIMFPDNHGEKPKIGTILLVSVKGQDPNKCVLLLTHIILSNIGAYNDSVKMKEVLDKQTVEIVAKVEAEKVAATKDADKELEVFKRLKETAIKRPVKKVMKQTRNKKK